MCDGQWVHHAEIQRYLKATTVWKRLARGACAYKVKERESDALVALWTILVERLEGPQHAR
jgi:hypothetical protein